MWTRYVWPIGLAVAIFYASDGQPAGFTTRWNDYHADKLAHLVIFGLLSISCCRLNLLGKQRPLANALFVIILTSLYGLTDELHQNTTPGRMLELGDWVADTVGAVIGVYLYTVWPCCRHFLETELRARKTINGNLK